MSGTERACTTCKHAELQGHEEPCRDCKRTRIQNSEGYRAAPDLWEPITPPDVKPVEQKTFQTVVRTRAKESKYEHEPGAFARLKDKLDDGWTVVMANPIGDEIEYILQRTEVEENG